ncbi:MAG: hypothetical protein KatS3mg132_876 [Limisphaera sp.]|nr:MAG: hypothetical protein KatS3mg132_876 [Limisphaera sp.]
MGGEGNTPCPRRATRGAAPASPSWFISRNFMRLARSNLAPGAGWRTSQKSGASAPSGRGIGGAIKVAPGDPAQSGNLVCFDQRCC